MKFFSPGSLFKHKSWNADGGNRSSANLKVEWFNAWDNRLDEALAQLPEMEMCSHEFYREIIRNPGHAAKRTALVSDEGKPVAVAALRNRGGVYWTPVTHWIVPGDIFPVLPGYAERVLEALGVNLWVACWRWPKPPGILSIARDMEEFNTHQMTLDQDFEGYWRQSSQHKSIRRIRNRCQDYTFEVNQPGALEWTIGQWEAKWRVDGALTSGDLGDRLLAARYLQERGRHFTLTLCDQGVPVAGETYLVHGPDLVSQICYRDAVYDQKGVATRLMELIFFWAAEKGYRKLDLGRTHEYKNRWAPLDGEIYTFNVCPGYQRQIQTARRMTGALRQCTAGLVRRLLTLIMLLIKGGQAIEAALF